MKPLRTAHLELARIQPPTIPLRIKIDAGGIQELADSFNRHGQLQPILVALADEDKFEIIDGHRRFLAAELLGWEKISATLRTADLFPHYGTPGSSPSSPWRD